MFNDELVNIVPLLGGSTNSRAYLLPTFICGKIDRMAYEDLSKWMLNIRGHSRRWVFGAHRKNHWMAMRIDWDARLIEHYDPMHQSMGRDGKGMLTVSHMANYV